MKPVNVYIPKDIGEVRDTLSAILLSAPKFEDKTGYLPFVDKAYVFRQLNEGLGIIRLTIGEARFQELLRWSDRMWAHFDADPDDSNGETLMGCKIIHQMDDLLGQVRRTK